MAEFPREAFLPQRNDLSDYLDKIIHDAMQAENDFLEKSVQNLMATSGITEEELIRDWVLEKRPAEGVVPTFNMTRGDNLFDEMKITWSSPYEYRIRPKTIEEKAFEDRAEFLSSKDDTRGRLIFGLGQDRNEGPLGEAFDNEDGTTNIEMKMFLDDTIVFKYVIDAKDEQ